MRKVVETALVYFFLALGVAGVFHFCTSMQRMEVVNEVP